MHLSLYKLSDYEYSLRAHLQMASCYNNEYISYRNSETHLKNTFAKDKFHDSKESAQEKELMYRMSSYDILQKAHLSPREYLVMHLHYLEYNSWTTIAKKLSISRRYTLQIHKRALNKIHDDGIFFKTI